MTSTLEFHPTETRWRDPNRHTFHVYAARGRVTITGRGRTLADAASEGASRFGLVVANATETERGTVLVETVSRG